MKLILGLTGMPASGKSTVADYLKKKKDVTYIHMSDFIWQELERQNIKKTNITGSMYGLYMHEIYKDQPIIKWTDQQIAKAKTKIILLDSIRALDQHLHFDKKNNYKLISVVTGPDPRFQREAKRKRFGETITKKMFQSRDTDELERGIGKVIALSDYYIDGNQPISPMLEESEKLFRKIKQTV